MSEDQQFDTNVQETIRAGGREAWRARFGEYEQALPLRSSFRSIKTWMGVAAGLLLICWVSWSVGVFDKRTDKLYAAYYSPHPTPSGLRGAGSNQAWADANEAYQKGDYAKAAASFQLLIEEGQYQAVYVPHFYVASALMALKNPVIPQIQAHLQAVLRTDNDYRLPAKWYLCLTYLKEEKYALVRSLLQQIIEEGDYKAEEAARLLNEL